MKTIMIPIYKQHNENIFDTLLKTEEIRKVKPKLELPFKCVVYEPLKFGGCGKCIGEFVVDCIEELLAVCYSQTNVKWMSNKPEEIMNNSCLSAKEFVEYLGRKDGYAWHITEPKRYDKPRELREFFVEGDCDAENCEFCNNFHRGRGWLDGSCCDEDDCNQYGIRPITRPPQNYIKIMEVSEIMNEYQERMKEWAESQDWNLIQKVFTIDCEHKEYSIEINKIGFAVSDFHNFEKELIDLIAKYRI